MTPHHDQINSAGGIGEVRQGLNDLFATIRRLTRADINDIAELLVEFQEADVSNDRERLEAAARAFLELVSKPDERYRPVPGRVKARRTEKLDRWMHFVGGKTRALREKKELTQADLARRAGLTQSHISRIELGQLSPSRRTVLRLAKALRVPLSSLDPSADA